MPRRGPPGKSRARKVERAPPEDKVNKIEYWNNIFNDIERNKYDKNLIHNHYKNILKNVETIEQLSLKSDIIRTILKESCSKQVMIMHSIEVINSIIRNWLLQKINRQYLHTIEPFSDIFWTRIFGSIPLDKTQSKETCLKYVNPVLEYFNVKNMIIAHTPQFIANQAGINNVCKTDNIGGLEN
jgi:hypothetical protein